MQQAKPVRQSFTISDRIRSSHRFQSLSNSLCGLFATGRETGPVVEVNKQETAILTDNGIPAIDGKSRGTGSLVCGSFELFEVESKMLRSTVMFL